MAVILRDSQEWRWSASPHLWEKGEESPARSEFFAHLQTFVLGLCGGRPYDVKLLTLQDFALLEEYHRRRVPSRGNLATNIKAGKVLFRQKGPTMVEVKKGYRSYREFMDRELAVLGLCHPCVPDGFYGVSVDPQTIVRVVKERRRFLFFTRQEERMLLVACVKGDLDALLEGAQGTLRISAVDTSAIPALKQLGEKLETTFGIKVEIVR